MLDKQMKKAKAAKEAKDPEQDFQDSLYPIRRAGTAFPRSRSRSAAVDACSHVDGVTKVEARGAFHIEGELVKDRRRRRRRAKTWCGSRWAPPTSGTAASSSRGGRRSSSATTRNVLSPEQIVNLFNTAGFAIGVGEWRPQRDGSYGMFHVAQLSEAYGELRRFRHRFAMLDELGPILRAIDDELRELEREGALAGDEFGDDESLKELPKEVTDAA
jgi:hypothetical protein